MVAFITESQVRSKVVGIDSQTAAILLAAHGVISVLRDSFDIFLSHSINDSVLVLGIKRVLEEAGKSVYIDWIDDPDLDREKVSGETADKLRFRMSQCVSLMYVYSQNSKRSRWMPWELGYFDGSNGNVAILPIVPDSGTLDFEREEYLQLYPKVDFINVSTTPAIFINQSRKSETALHKRFDDWKAGTDKLRPR